MILGIVGSEAAKFTVETQAEARRRINRLFEIYRPSKVVSGRCPLGGIDIWAIEEAIYNGIPYEEFPPGYNTWRYYKRRNIRIAGASSRVVCLTVRDLPPGFKEGGWERYCYHCQTDQHIKSGGCWTVKYAREKLGKPGEIIVI